MSKLPPSIRAFVRLALRFQEAPLLQEALAVERARWGAHFNADYHDGGWQGVALRAVAREITRLYSDPNLPAAVTDTALLAKSPAIQAALATFQCPLRDVRLLCLAPGSTIREHRDDDLRLDAGEARLHIPLITHPQVEFYVDSQRVQMMAGECWYLNPSLPHRIRNASPIERIHLVVDCVVNDWLLEQILLGDVPPRCAAAPSGQAQFFAFREAVWADIALAQHLMAITDNEVFKSAVVSMGGEHGFYFSADDVASAMMRGRQTWMSQWIV